MTGSTDWVKHDFTPEGEASATDATESVLGTQCDLSET